MAQSSLPELLANVNTTQLNFSQACTSITNATKLYDQYFCLNCNASAAPWYQSSEDNNDTVVWIDFWAAALKTYPPLDHSGLLTEENVWQWAKTSTTASDFFLNPTVSTNASWYADDIAIWGGCVGNKTLNEQDASIISDNSYDFNDMIEDCMSIFCCQIPLDSNLLSDDTTPYRYYPEWNTAETCSFHTCEAATQGNPDLAGIGVSPPVPRICSETC